jgi:glutathione S-transferase
MKANMKLIYRPLSPYSRNVYLLALELGLANAISLEKVVVAPVPYPGWSDNNLDVAAAGNPVAKVPTLVVDFVDGPVRLFDSKVICEYLLAKAGNTDDGEPRNERDKLRLKTAHACCDAITDAEIICIYEDRIRQEHGIYYHVWVDGQREKVYRGFGMLDRMVKEGVLRHRRDDKTISVTEIATAVTLGFFDMRTVVRRTRHEDLEKWLDGVKNRPSFVQAPLGRNVNWKTKSKLA